jgi:hypothetical protein
VTIEPQGRQWSGGVVHPPRDVATLAMTAMGMVMAVALVVMVLFFDTRANFQESTNQINRMGAVVKDHGDMIAGQGQAINSIDRDLGTYNGRFDAVEKNAGLYGVRLSTIEKNADLYGGRLGTLESAVKSSNDRYSSMNQRVRENEKKVEILMGASHSHRAEEQHAIAAENTGSAVKGQSNGMMLYDRNNNPASKPEDKCITITKTDETTAAKTGETTAIKTEDPTTAKADQSVIWPLLAYIGLVMAAIFIYLVIEEHMKK